MVVVFMSEEEKVSGVCVEVCFEIENDVALS